MRPVFPVNPFREALGIEIEIPRAGECVATMPPVPAACDPEGQISQGAVATLCDITMGHAIGGQLTERTPFATVHLQIAFLRAAGSQPLRGDGVTPLLPEGWKEAMAACRVLRADGEVCATAQGFFARSPDRGDQPRESAAPPPARPDARSLPALLSIGPGNDGTPTLELRPVLLNPDGVGHGGALASALDLAMRGALEAQGVGPLALRTLDVRYMLPAPPGEVRLEVEIDRKGRSIHFLRAVAKDGKERALCAAVGIYGAAFRD